MSSTETQLKLSCEGCPAIFLRTDIQLLKINHWHQLRLQQLTEIGKPKIILLCESFPEDRYLYDIETIYGNRGLRTKLKTELYGSACSDKQFLDNLQSDKILIVDCAFCPLFQLSSKSDMRHAATHCLQKHTLTFLNQFREIPIFSIFPSKRGFLKQQVPELMTRIRLSFAFNQLSGLKYAIANAVS